MNIHINTNPSTIDELIAEHGDRIVRVQCAIDSADMLLTLEIRAQYEHLATLRYISNDGRWYLQAYTMDSSDWEPRNEVAVNYVLDVMRKMKL